MAPTPERAGSEPRRQYDALCVPADGRSPSTCAMTPATASTCWLVRGPVSRSSARIAHSVAHNAHSAAPAGHRRVLRRYRPNPTQRALEGLPQGRNDVRRPACLRRMPLKALVLLPAIRHHVAGFVGHREVPRIQPTAAGSTGGITVTGSAGGATFSLNNSSTTASIAACVFSWFVRAAASIAAALRVSASS